MKKAMILTGDYWHSRESIAPLMPLLFENAEEYLLTEDPADFYGDEYSLLISFKDPIENDRIPTPVWCDEKWTDTLLERIDGGMGFIAVHAAVTDLPAEHRIVSELYKAMFVTHPEACPVTFVPEKEHPVLEGVSGFTYPENEEHYVIEADESADILAYTVSQHGRQPALWVTERGRGKVCMFTPAHTIAGLTCEGNVRIMKNMIKWCKAE